MEVIMKKILVSAVAVLLAAVLFVGCGAKTADLSKVLSDINSQFSDATKGLTEIKDASELNTYYQISEDDVKQFAAEINTDASTAPVEIVMVEGKDKAAADRVKECLDRRYNSIKSQYASYSAEQFDMVKKCGVTTSGNYVVMIVAENYDGIIKVVNEAIG